jgi:hypothetical protein
MPFARFPHRLHINLLLLPLLLENGAPISFLFEVATPALGPSLAPTATHANYSSRASTCNVNKEKRLRVLSSRVRRALNNARMGPTIQLSSRKPMNKVLIEYQRIIVLLDQYVLIQS